MGDGHRVVGIKSLQAAACRDWAYLCGHGSSHAGGAWIGIISPSVHCPSKTGLSAEERHGQLNTHLVARYLGVAFTRV